MACGSRDIKQVNQYGCGAARLGEGSFRGPEINGLFHLLKSGDIFMGVEEGPSPQAC